VEQSSFPQSAFYELGVVVSGNMAPFLRNRIRTAKLSTGVAMRLRMRVALISAPQAPFDIVPSRNRRLALFGSHPRFLRRSRHGFRSGLFFWCWGWGWGWDCCCAGL